MIGQIIGGILTNVITEAIRETKEQPRVEVIEKPVVIPPAQQPSNTLPQINFNLTINVLSSQREKDLPVIDAKDDTMKIDLK